MTCVHWYTTFRVFGKHFSPILSSGFRDMRELQAYKLYFILLYFTSPYFTVRFMHYIVSLQHIIE